MWNMVTNMDKNVVNKVYKYVICLVKIELSLIKLMKKLKKDSCQCQGNINDSTNWNKGHSYNSAGVTLTRGATSTSIAKFIKL